MCATCDERGGITHGVHKETHTLLRIYETNMPFSTSMMPPGESGDPMSPRRGSRRSPSEEPYYIPPGVPYQRTGTPVSNEGRDGLETRVSVIESRFDKIEDQLTRMERMLEVVLSLSGIAARRVESASD